MSTPDLSSLSDTELSEHISRLNLRIAELAPQLDTSRDQRRRTVRIVRGTILTAGGLFTAGTVDLLGILLVILGCWDWAEGISDDAEATNRGLAVRRRMNEFEAELEVIATELRRRGYLPQQRH
jgi:hypothetical protein